MCGATHLCADAKNVKQLNSRPLFMSIVRLWIFWVIKRNLGVRYVCAGPFLFLPFIGKCAFGANNMRSFVLTHCRVAFHQKDFFNSTYEDLFQHILSNELTRQRITVYFNCVDSLINVSRSACGLEIETRIIRNLIC